MDTLKNQQEKLIAINNLCHRFSTEVEEHLNDPDHQDIIALIKQLSVACGDYLKTEAF
jgi:hypothetical protein